MIGETKTKMGKYGLGSRTNEMPHANPTTDGGKDEIDNIFSKHQSPNPITAKRIAEKRNSCDEGHSYTEDSDTRMNLAKSLPIHLESLLSHSSDEFGNWPSLNELNRSAESMQNKSYQHDYDSSNASNFESFTAPSIRTHDIYRNRPTRLTESRHQASLYLVILIAVIAIALAVYHSNLPSSIPDVLSTSKTYNTASFYNDLNNLEEQYLMKHNSILQLQTGISTIFKREDTGSFVFAYKSNSKDFDHDKFNNLVNTVAAAASKYLRNDSISVQHIVIDGSKLEMHSHSELISKYRDKITETGVMLVREVDEVPSALAMAFHYYCDEYNPLVKRSAIFFTLDMAKCSHNAGEQNPTYSHIEKCLKKKWRGVPEDNINPLINRVVNTVVDVVGD